MSTSDRLKWDERHQAATADDPEQIVLEALPLMRPGLALDVAAGLGRNSLALAREGIRCVAVDSSAVAMHKLRQAALEQRLQVQPVVADLANFVIRPDSFDVVLNINFLDRALVPALKRALRPGGVLVFETFLIDQAEIGHPRNPDYLLRHYELREMTAGLELLCYREGFGPYGRQGEPAWRSEAIARRIR
jgi:tellurite methyltransferase